MTIGRNTYPKFGDSGLEVLKYQKMLQKAGSTIQANGKFTIGMMSAIKAFQKKNGIKVTGKLDKKTVDKLSAVKTSKKK